MGDFTADIRFSGIQPLAQKALLASPTMHEGAEMVYIREAYESGWMTTVGSNIDNIEKAVADYIQVRHALALSSGTAAIHLAIKLAAGKLYPSDSSNCASGGKGNGGCLRGRRVFCSDLTFAATVNPVVYEGGEPVFIDSAYGTWNMDPAALERAFDIYPDVKLVVLAHLYGNPQGAEEIKAVCHTHGALLVEDAAEALGAYVGGRPAGSYGDYGVISFNGNKIITGSAGGMLLADDGEDIQKARKWSAQARESVPWYEHRELGYNYRMSNVVAGVVRGQWEFLEDHIRQKQRIYERYQNGLSDLPVEMNPVCADGRSNYWLSCMLIHENAVAESKGIPAQGGDPAVAGKTCPAEILDALACFHAEGRPVWKPMHLQPFYRENGFVTADADGHRDTGSITGGQAGVSADLFRRGVCLPSDNKMSLRQQDVIIDVIHRCFR